ncbi:uncharacterized protein PHACADRAFT_201695 [Phanerochaete carnosa HHB-10118-sp]|uniref:Uncharacterized protein n=1 Tax=Phanerochaete carnosa (strain HHB-10118-sp) TaxID=650164 RepID=K5VRQ2_PHACS|nr:uncharacterized protein PHACADRAFT_201695 [Phanerochaete carnosa HHB-10118-sp]EKM49435.1 hypothetical protein PHACADRAFT_201695 [Phanerochaete carnosa HHB-10118-sp]
MLGEDRNEPGARQGQPACASKFPRRYSLAVADASGLLQRYRQSANFPPANAQIYFGAAKRDYACLLKIGYASFTQEVFSKHSVTINKCNADHWCILSHADEIALGLEKWIWHRYHDSRPISRPRLSSLPVVQEPELYQYSSLTRAHCRMNSGKDLLMTPQCRVSKLIPSAVVPSSPLRKPSSRAPIKRTLARAPDSSNSNQTVGWRFSSQRPRSGVLQADPIVLPWLSIHVSRLAPHLSRLNDKSYGVLALGTLGYGGANKSIDPAAYVPNLISKDIGDVLDAEKLEKIIAIGYDWCCKAISRLTNHHLE